jgi:hypothetical protein
LVGGTPVISVRYELDPFGFMGRAQALNGRGKAASELALDLVKTLARQQASKARMGEALAARLARSASYGTARRFAELLPIAEPLSVPAKEIVKHGFRANTEIQHSDEVPEMLSRLIGHDLSAEGL